MKKLLLPAIILISLCSYNAQALNYYWVGGNGNWSDLGHWSLTSGGVGSAVAVPGPADDVFFDANSFAGSGQIVTINTAVAICHNMDWTGALTMPTLAGSSSNKLNIFGSLRFIAAMNLTFSGETHFSATNTGHTITSAGHQFLNHVVFDGTGGGWTLMDAFNTVAWIYFNNGSLNTNNMTVHCDNFNSVVTNVRSLTLGSSVITISGAASSWWVDDANFTFSSGTSMLRFTSNLSPAMKFSDNLIFYDAEFTSSSGTGNITSMNGATFHSMYFAGDGNIDGNHTYGTLTFSAGMTYTIESGKSETIITALNSIGSCPNKINIFSSIPGSFATFMKTSGSITVNFNVLRDIRAMGGATYTANNSFDLGGNTGWIINAPVPGTTPTITVNGSDLTSSPGISYTWFLNGNPIIGANSQTYTALVTGDYFVVVPDINGCNDTSATVHIIVSDVREKDEFPNFSVFPNPFTELLTIELSLNKVSEIAIELYNTLGQRIATIANNEHLDAGNYLFTINRHESGFAVGVYLLRVTVNKDTMISSVVSMQ